MIPCYLDTFIIQIPSRPPTTRPIRRRRHIQRPGVRSPRFQSWCHHWNALPKNIKKHGVFRGSDVRHFAAEVPNAVPKAHLALFHSPGPPRRMLRYVHGSHFLGNPTQKERTKRNHNLCPYKIPVLTLKYEYAETM